MPALQLVSPLIALSPQSLTALNLYVFLPFFPISAPSVPLGVNPFYPCYAHFHPILWHPRWLCILPAHSLPLLLQSLVFLLLSQHHNALNAKFPTPLSLPPDALCEVLHRCCSPSYQTQDSSPYVTSYPCRSCFNYFFNFRELWLSRLNFLCYCLFARSSAIIYILIRFPTFFSPQFFSFSVLLCLCFPRSTSPTYLQGCDWKRWLPTRRAHFPIALNTEKQWLSHGWPRSPPQRDKGKGWLQRGGLQTRRTTHRKTQGSGRKGGGGVASSPESQDQGEDAASRGAGKPAPPSRGGEVEAGG